MGRPQMTDKEIEEDVPEVLRQHDGLFEKAEAMLAAARRRAG